MILIDSWTASDAVDKTLTKACTYIWVKNDDETNSMTITINGISVVILAGESFSENFQSFTTVGITNADSVSYRAYTKGSRAV